MNAPARRKGPAAPPELLDSRLRFRYDVDGLDNRDPWFVEQVVRVVERVIVPYHRAEIRGLERIPEGGALYVGNHSGGSMTLDSFIFGAAVYRARGLDDCPHVLAHDFALRLPGLHQVFTAVGAVRASADNARRLFEAGHKVLVYPGGERESHRPFSQRNRIAFGGRTGYVRIALRHRVPIVPVVGQGSHATFVVLSDGRRFAHAVRLDRLFRIHSWPLTFSLPWGLTPFPPPIYWPLPTKIRMEVLDPIRFEEDGPEAARDDAYVARCARSVEVRMQESLDRLAAEGRATRPPAPR